MLLAAGDELDFLSHHLYDSEDPAGVLERLAGETPFGADPSRWGEIEPSVREVLASAGFDRPLWLTETGWVTTRLDESLQADRYAHFLELWRGGGEIPAWPVKVFFYELQDDPDPSVPKFGILRTGGRQKPAFGVLRDFIAAQVDPPDAGDPPPGPPVGEGPRPRIRIPD